MKPFEILIWAGAYVVVGAVFFGVMCSAINGEGKLANLPLKSVFVAAALWPLTTIAALSYMIASWFSPKA